MKKVLIINGPNLNMLGKREPEIYGKTTLKELEKICEDESKKFDYNISFFQSNSEAEIIEKIQKCQNYDGLIINGGAFTHTSIAIHDALKVLKIAKIEVHISNIYNREEFRKKSFISPAVNGIIAGFGIDVYLIALGSLRNLF
ncbi:MAG: type II 3-dehydroquinate dehydratase [Pelagibacteraceae bacterium TMED124]|nr:type II 3-dehydroquinate dehydratase [Rickettsiales bacterium]RPG16665.1 MAG: type II 3-dehydroquinate dehydratase [Pelagibacteraceae bacterium TMED124]|tara:strand:+ start:4872 stop:5300 length:429 start_codon:yes stop_codon:yes gene_type:complete